MAQDTFTRTTAYGLGTDGTFTYVWDGVRDTKYSVASDSPFHVDGSQVVMPDGGNDWDSYVITAPTPGTSGTASYDVYFPTLNPGDYWGTTQLHLTWTNRVFSGDYINVMLGWEHNYSDNQIDWGPYYWGFDWDSRLQVQVRNTSTIEPGNWYTFKVSYTVAADSNFRAGYKLWKRGDAEPDFQFIYQSNYDWSSFSENYGDAYDGKPWLDFGYTGDPAVYLDNLTFGAYEEIPYRFTAGAYITGPALVTRTDTFTRSSSYGLGSDYPFISDQGFDVGGTYSTRDSLFYYPPQAGSSSISDPTADPVTVGGSSVILASSSPRARSSYLLPGIRPTTGWASFDFKTPTEWSYQTVAALFLKANNFWFGMTLNSYFSNQWQVAWPNLFGSPVSLSASTWYTAKILYDGDTGQQVVLIKAQGASDSSALVTVSNTLTHTDNSYPDQHILTLYPRLLGSNIEIDNLSWIEIGFGTRSSIFKADAFIGRQFTADAFIVDQNVTLYVDTFTRTTSYGLGPGYTFRPSGGPLGTFQSSFATASSSLITVDGSEIVIPYAVTYGTRDAYNLPTQRMSGNGYMAFDFYVPVPSSNTISNGPVVYVNFDTYTNSVGSYGTGLAITSNSQLGVIAFGGYTPLYGGLLTSTSVPAVGAWYTALVCYTGGEQSLYLLDMNGAVVGQYGPVGATNLAGYGGIGYGLMIALLTGPAGVWKIDNLRWTIPAHAFTADALIIDRISLKADAVIRQSKTGSLTADASIVSFVGTILANAVKQIARSSSATANAVLASKRFRADAFISDTNIWRHYRDRDHTGTLQANEVILTAPIGRFPAGSTLYTVLAGLWADLEEEGLV